MEIFSLLGDFGMESDSSASMEAMMGFSGFGVCFDSTVIRRSHRFMLTSYTVNLRTDTFEKYFILYLTQWKKKEKSMYRSYKWCYVSQYFNLYFQGKIYNNDNKIEALSLAKISKLGLGQGHI